MPTIRLAQSFIRADLRQKFFLGIAATTALATALVRFFADLLVVDQSIFFLDFQLTVAEILALIFSLFLARNFRNFFPHFFTRRALGFTRRQILAARLLSKIFLIFSIFLTTAFFTTVVALATDFSLPAPALRFFSLTKIFLTFLLVLLVASASSGFLAVFVGLVRFLAAHSTTLFARRASSDALPALTQKIYEFFSRIFPDFIARSHADFGLSVDRGRLVFQQGIFSIFLLIFLFRLAPRKF
jgi:hypothetical protein